jgi:hypothetical protein
MDEYNDLLFKLNGGWPAVIINIIFSITRYISIGYLIHSGWKMAA